MQAKNGWNARRYWGLDAALLIHHNQAQPLSACLPERPIGHLTRWQNL